jgi:hypothetical protein
VYQKKCATPFLKNYLVMTIEAIEKFANTSIEKENILNIYFKERSTIKGLFIKEKDFDELKEKNFWRIVSTTVFAEWEKTKNRDLVRIFNGNLITKISIINNN